MDANKKRCVGLCGKEWNSASLWACGYGLAYPRVQPLRKVGLMSLLASALLVIRIFSLSHSSFPSNRSASTPSEIHSVNGPATLKFEQAGSPPLHARIQSR